MSINWVKDVFSNTLGWHTNRKILVIESDDWGSIRMPSKEIKEKLEKRPNFYVNDPYNQFDTLASETDLEALFESLHKYRDFKGKHPTITANCVMANPDFDAIKYDQYESYKYEKLEQTFERYNNLKALELWKKGLDEGIFIPQFHCREHVNVPFWMEKLQNNFPGVRDAFDHGVFGCSFFNLNLKNKPNFQRAWDFKYPSQANFIAKSIQEGLNMFRKHFEYYSKTSVAPAYTWSPGQEDVLYRNGVQSMQTTSIQKIPLINKDNYRKKFRYTKKPNSGMGYTQRNVVFELSGKNKEKTFGKALRQIEKAFRWNKPAIIVSHRLNYIGGIDLRNRQENLVYLERLLGKIKKMWPEVEFMSSAQLQHLVQD